MRKRTESNCTESESFPGRQKALAHFFNGGITEADERRGFKYTTLASKDAIAIADDMLRLSNTTCPVEAFLMSSGNGQRKADAPSEGQCLPSRLW